MKNLKYILIAIIFMFIGINGVSASHLDRTCIYESNDGNTKLAVKWEERAIGALGNNISSATSDVEIIYYNKQSLNFQFGPVNLTGVFLDIDYDFSEKTSIYMNNKKCFDYGVLVFISKGGLQANFKFYLAETLDEATQIYNEQDSEVLSKDIVSMVNDSIPVEDWEQIINPDDSDESDDDIVTPDYETGCGIFGNTIVGIIKNIYGYFKWIIPTLIVILSMLDFFKVVGTGKDDDFKKAQNNLIKRIILGIVFFLIPTLISMIINFSGITESIEDGDSIWSAVTCILE